MNSEIANVASYIAAAPKEIRPMLTALRRAIKKGAPKAKERISYGMPFYEYGGTGYKGRFVYFAAFKKHISVFIPPLDASEIPTALKKFHVSKATYRFPLGTPLPLALIERTVKKLAKEREKRSNEAT